MLLVLIGCGVVLCAALWIQFSGHPSLYDAHGDFYGQDFLNYWGAPQLATQDITSLFSIDRYNAGLETLYGTVLGEHTIRNWSYPLHLLPLLWPFGQLSLPAALVVWNLLGLLCYGLIVYYGAPSQRRFACMLALLAPASFATLWMGQNGFFTAALFLGALLWLNTRPALAGIALGVLTVKPQLGLIWPLLLLRERRWQTIAAAVLTALLLVALSLALYGVDAWQQFFDKALAIQLSILHAETGQFLYQMMMPSLPIALQRMGVAAQWAFLAQWVLSGVVAVLVWRALRAPLAFSHRALLITSAAMLVTPYLFNYDLTILTGALVWRMLDTPPRTRFRAVIYALAYLLPVLVYIFYVTVALAPAIVLALFLITLRDDTPSSEKILA